MTGTPLLPTAAALLAVLLPACADRDGPSPAGEQPDLVLVVVDTLRADHLSAYGYHRPTSPALAALAAQGALFEDVTAQSSWTLPSMASMLTGRHVFANAQVMPNGVGSLAERLSAAGYETLAFVANPAVSAAGRYDRGFDAYVTRDDTGGQMWDAFDLEDAVEQTLAERTGSDAPRLLYLHLLDPHWPYAPDPEPELDGEPHLRDDVLKAWVEVVQADDRVREHFDTDRRTILADIDAYDREIVNVDAVIGRLVQRLRRPGRELLVVVASDHGEGLWTRRHHPEVVQRKVPEEERTLREVFFRDHAYHMFQDLLGTPLIVSGPGFGPDQRITTPVENVDILPTLLRAAGLPDDPQLDGRPLQDVVAGTAAPRDVLYAHSNEATVVRRVEGHKLVFPTGTGDSFGMPMMLFDLGSDPYERDNRADPERRDEADVTALQELLALQRRALDAFDLYDDQPLAPEGDGNLDVLRELGYVGPGFDRDGDEDASGR